MHAMHIDEISLAAAIIRHAGVSQGEAALGLAADLLQRLGTPTLGMMADPETDRAAPQNGPDANVANFGVEP